MKVTIFGTPFTTRTGVMPNAVVPMLLALWTTGAALAPTRIQAGDFSAHSERVYSQRLSLAGLDLTSPAGARKAYARINEAAWSVCGKSSLQIEVMVNGPGECVQAAIAGAVRAVRSAELSAMYIKTIGIVLATLYGVRPPIITADN